MDDPSGLPLWTTVPAGMAIGAWAGFSATSGWIVVFPMLFVLGERPLFECLLASLIADWVNAAAASLLYVRRGEADLAVALRWMGVSAPLILVGVGIARVVLPRLDTVLGLAAGPVAIGMGLILLRRAWRGLGSRAPGSTNEGPPGVAAAHATALLRIGITGNGVLMGLLGQGGGLNAALLLMWLRRYPTRTSVATALALVAFSLPVGIGAYVLVVGGAPGLWAVLAPLLVASAVGSTLAAWQSGRVREHQLELVVAACVLLAGTAASIERWLLMP